jgi:DNA primase
MKTTSKLLKLDTLKEQLRTRLSDYLSRFREIRPGKNFLCVNPAHQERMPSCGIVPGNQELFHCFGCSAVGDVFVAAHFLEGKPLRGPGFLADNLYYLAGMFGMEVPQLDLSPEEQHDLDTYRAYATAANILLTSKLSERVTAKLQSYGWSSKTQRELGIGSVESFESYLGRMVNVYGYDRSFLRAVDLTNRLIFHPDHLIYTVKDEYGQPVGFASRNLVYEQALASFEELKKQYAEDAPELSAAKQNLPTKFVNTRQGDATKLENRIYNKSRRLFGLHIARRNAPPLYVLEGYGDAATAYNCGLYNAVAIGATSFTADHLNLLLELGIEHVIFVLDGDKAGRDGTERFINLVEEHLGNHVGLRIEIVLMPKGSDDPDALIRAKGLEAFLSLPRLDVFSWRLDQAMAKGESPDQIFERVLPLIVNEPNNLRRFRMGQAMAASTAIPADVIFAEVTRRTDVEGQRINAEIALLAKRTSKRLDSDPSGMMQILTETSEAAERIGRMKQGHDKTVLAGYFEGLFEEQQLTEDKSGLKTGWPYFDRVFGGIPKRDVFITIPGKPNHAKTSSHD